MNTLGYCLAAAIAASPMALLATPAAAQIASSYVSRSGDDTSDCTDDNPCRTFAGAYAKTTAGGTIYCLSSGRFGALTITRSLVISCNTVEAIIGLGDFYINVPGIQVTLRSIRIETADNFPRSYGILIDQPSTLILENLVLRGATNTTNGFGVAVRNTTGTAEISIKDSIASDNRVGIRIQPTGNGSAKVAISGSHITDNGAGIQADASGTTGQIALAITDTVLDGNTNSGLALSGGTGRIAAVASRMASVNNGGHGVRVANTNAALRLSDSDINGNMMGTEALNGGVITSFGNNRIIGNNGNNGAPPPVIPLQ